MVKCFCARTSLVRTWLAEVALSTAALDVYFPLVGTKGGPLPCCGPDTHRCRVDTQHLWGQGNAARVILTGGFAVCGAA
jgi:hypothetical protein